MTDEEYEDCDTLGHCTDWEYGWPCCYCREPLLTVYKEER